MVNCKKTSEIKQCNEWTPQIGQQSRVLSRLMISSKIINIYYVVSTIRFIKGYINAILKIILQQRVSIFGSCNLEKHAISSL